MKKIQILCMVVFLTAISPYSFACTIFTASIGNVVLAGNNEDMCTTNTLIHIIPPSNEKYGRIFWGFMGDGNYQGGMNEYGLFFDGASTPSVEMGEWDLPEFEGNYIFETVLGKCKTVDEAIDMVKKYKHPYLQFCHILVADANGDAVIFEWGNNQMNYIRKGSENFLIATNFNFTETTNPEKECNRYAAAKKMLTENKPSIHLFEEILSVTHAEGNFPTVYSNLCDLKNGKMYLYNFHNYTFRKEIDLKKEFQKGEQKFMVRSIFPETNAELLFRYMNDCIDNFEDIPSHAVTFTVNTKRTPPKGNIFLQGSAKELGDWDEPGIEMEKQSENVFQKTISFKNGKLFGFNIGNGGGDFVPVGATGKKISDEVIDVKSDTTIVIEVYDWRKM